MTRLFLQLFLLVSVMVMVSGFMFKKKLNSPTTYEMKQKLLTVGTSSYTIKDSHGTPVYKVCLFSMFWQLNSVFFASLHDRSVSKHSVSANTCNWRIIIRDKNTVQVSERLLLTLPMKHDWNSFYLQSNIFLIHSVSQNTKFERTIKSSPMSSQ
jgi:hypothetical protein